MFEVISWACTEPGKPVHWIWKFLDLVNILQAVAIFVVFVCNQKTLTELTEKFPRLKSKQILNMHNIFRHQTCMINFYKYARLGMHCQKIYNPIGL